MLNSFPLFCQAERGQKEQELPAGLLAPSALATRYQWFLLRLSATSCCTFSCLPFCLLAFSLLPSSHGCPFLFTSFLAFRSPQHRTCRLPSHGDNKTQNDSNNQLLSRSSERGLFCQSPGSPSTFGRLSQRCHHLASTPALHWEKATTALLQDPRHTSQNTESKNRK